MGNNKRPQQIHTGLGTDFKTRTDDEHIHEEDKQHLHEERGRLAIPKREENPALTSLKGRKGRKGKKGPEGHQSGRE